MFTRYVWSKNRVNKNIIETERYGSVDGMSTHTENVLELHENSDSTRVKQKIQVSVVVYDSITINTSERISGIGGTVYSSNIIENGDLGMYGISVEKSGYIQRSYNDWCKFQEGRSGTISFYVASDCHVTTPAYFQRAVSVDIEQEKGTLTGYVSSATNGQYPADGVSGNVYFFKHLYHVLIN